MPRTRLARLGLAVMVLLGSAVVVDGAAPTATVGAVGTAAASSPFCTFNGSALAFVIGATPGKQVKLSCTGLSPLHPYLVMETSLLLGIDPKAAPLLTGNIVSIPGLLALFAALPEINPRALTFPFSDLSGHMDTTYTLPSSQAPDPNASCPPTTAQINAGLIGCGLAMIDLTTFKTVGAGSAVVEYKGDPFLPPDPTLALSPAKATTGQAVSVRSVPGATTYWWLATLSALGALLGGGAAPPPTVTVNVGRDGSSVTAANNITVSPAVYNNPVLTPPKISGTFTLPSGVAAGRQKVTVTFQAQLLIFLLSISAASHIKVH